MIRNYFWIIAPSSKGNNMAVAVSATVAAFSAVATEATVATVLGAVAAVGTDVALVGAVTGNKSLAKFGAEVSLASGIGSGFASWASDAAGAAGADAAGSAAAAGAGASSAATDLASSGLADGTINPQTMDSSLTSDGAASNIPSSSLGANTSMNNVWSPQTQTSTAAPSTFSDATQQLTSANQLPGAPINPADDVFSPTSGLGNPAAGVGTNVAGAASPSDDFFTKLKDKLGTTIESAKDWFNGKDPRVQAEIVKSILAIPGSIQAQKNAEVNQKIAQQNADANTARVAQTSYGSQVPTFGTASTPYMGIINQKIGG